MRLLDGDTATFKNAGVGVTMTDPTERLTKAATAFAVTWLPYIPREHHDEFMDNYKSLLRSALLEMQEWTLQLATEFLNKALGR